jgi:hypothetical protein
MKLRILALLGTSAAAALMATAAVADTTPAAPPPPSAAPYPAMSADIAMPAPPTTVDLGFLGKVSIGGVISAFAQTQSNPVFSGVTGKLDQTSSVDLSNAQIFINKSDGVFQYFIQAGTYSLPALGPSPYISSSKTPALTFGNLPQAFVKIVPNSTFSIEAGALPTLVGDEYTFSFENLNIERGLLWGIEPAVSRGVQANYTQGPVAASISFNDGLYSNQYNTVSGLVTWTVTPTDTLAVAGTGTTKKTTFSALNNQTLINVLYTHVMGQWTINPYFQYSDIPKYVPVGQLSDQQITSGALLVNYAFDSKSPFSGVSLPFRGEYVSSTGFQKYNAYSITFTPTYQYKIYFIRGEVSYTDANIGLFGSTGTAKSQTRGLIETGVI